MNDGKDAKRRCRHEIVDAILKSAVNGKAKTHIMYKAKLNYAQLNKYLSLLVENGFIENVTVKHRNQHKKIFQITLEGMKLRENLKSINKL